MTPNQNQAIEDVRKILKLHCDSWILSYRITGEDFNTEVNHDWHGNIITIVGLTQVANARVMRIAVPFGGEGEPTYSV